MEFSILDISALVTLGFFGFLGFKQGFAKHLSALLTFLLTVMIIYYIYPVFLEYLANTFGFGKASTLAIGLITLILLSIGLFVILKQILSTGISANLSEKMNKWLGGLFGIFRGALVMIIILTIAMHINEKAVHKSITKKSLVGKWFGNNFYNKIEKHINQEELKDSINALNDRVEWPEAIEDILE